MNAIEHKSLWKDDFKALDNNIDKEIIQLDLRLTKEIKETRVDMITWMFIFCIGQIGVGLNSSSKCNVM